MTERVKPAPLIGGPLDGTTYSPTSRWPSYLTDTGETMHAPAGDRLFSASRTKRKAKHESGYRLMMDGHGVRSYVHSSVPGSVRP